MSLSINETANETPIKLQYSKTMAKHHVGEDPGQKASCSVLRLMKWLTRVGEQIGLCSIWAVGQPIGMM